MRLCGLLWNSVTKTPKKHCFRILFEKLLSKAIYVLQHGKIQLSLKWQNLMWQFPEKFRFYCNGFDNLSTPLPDAPGAIAALHLVMVARKAAMLAQSTNMDYGLNFKVFISFWRLSSDNMNLKCILKTFTVTGILSPINDHVFLNLCYEHHHWKLIQIQVTK